MALGTATAPHELRFDAGRICLDLLATTHPGERLGSVEVLRAWITGSGLVPAGTPLAHADLSWLVAFRELRGQLVPLVRGRAAPGVPSYDLALARVNDLARAAPPAPRAVPGDDGTLERRLDGPPG
ncbi:ABATE domain-containing protein, partial [Streptomyces sp. G35A]